MAVAIYNGLNAPSSNSTHGGKGGTITQTYSNGRKRNVVSDNVAPINARSMTQQNAANVKDIKSASTQPVASKSATQTTAQTVAQNVPTFNYSTNSDDVLNQIKALLSEQKSAADKYYKSLYEQQLNQNKEAYEANRNQINTNYMRGNRYINSMYGDAISGTGLSNRARNMQNWQSSLASNRQNYTNNNASAQSAYNSGLANNASSLAQGWYNYVMPIYSNRQQTVDDYNYRKYLASL